MNAILARTAWRNLFRNGRRSAIAVAAVAVGLAGGVFLMLFTAGMLDQMVDTSVSQLGHLQIQRPGYAANPSVTRTMPYPRPALDAVRDLGDTAVQVAPRLAARGLARSARHATGVRIIGVEAAREAAMTRVADRLVDGHYLTGETSLRRQEAVIGCGLAADLGVGVGRKVVLVTQALAADGRNTEMSSGAFRVVGVFRLASERFNETMVFVNLEDARELLGVDGLSEVAVMLGDRDLVPAVSRRLSAALDSARFGVRTWRQESRAMVRMLDTAEAWLLVYVGVVLLAAAFGIVNTMLMAVFERSRELGILRGLGTSRWALFRLVVYEALFLSLIGAAGGLVAMGVLHLAWLRHGLDLSVFAAGLAMLGSDVIIKPAVRAELILATIALVVVMAVAAAAWPAARAARLKPATAMREG